MTEQTAPKGRAFISYSRKDKEFVRKLESNLEALGVSTWVDWEGIPLSADWMAEITTAIQGADAFLFIISPDSLNSKVCGEELALGLKYNKKLVPVLFREAEPGQSMHEKLAATNWVYLRQQDDFDATLPKLVEAINTDLAWVRQHTRLLTRAVEWDTKQRNSSFLLQGADLTEAEHWLVEGSTKAGREVTPLHVEYIRASRQQTIRRQRILLAGVLLALIVSVVLAIAAVFQSIQADANARLAEANANDARTKEAQAVDNKILADNNAGTAQANEKLAEDNAQKAKDNELRANENAATAVANEHIAATQRAIAVENERLAQENARLALARRGAAQAKLVQQQPAQLYLSTLLALHSLSLAPSSEAEEVLRQNLSLMALPVAGMSRPGAVTAAQFSPDGSQVISAHGEASAFLWDARSGEKIAELPHNGPVTVALFTPDGKWIVTGGEDGSVRLWDRSKREAIASPVSVFEPPQDTPETQKNVTFVAVSRDSQWLAASREDGRVAIISLSARKLHTILNCNSYPYTMAFSPNGKRLAVATKANAAQIWDPLNAILYLTVKHDDEVYWAIFSPDGQTVTTASRDQTSKVVSVVSGKVLAEFQHDDWVEDVDFSPDGVYVVTASDDNTVGVWEVAGGRQVHVLRHTGFVQHVVYSSDGRWIASASYDGTARVWDALSGQELARIPLEGGGTALAFSHDNQLLLTGNDQGQVRVWDIHPLASLATVLLNDQLIRSITFSPDQQWLASAADDSVVRLWRVEDLVASSSVTEEEVYTIKSGFVRSLQFHPTLPQLAVSSDTDIALVNLNDLRTVQINFEGHFNRVAYNSSGDLFAASTGEGDVILIDPLSATILGRLPQVGGAYSLSFSNNDRFLASGGEGAIWLWDVTRGISVTVAEQPGRILDVSFSADGQWLASGSSEGDTLLWQVAGLDQDQPTLTPKYSLKDDGAINDVDFSPDGRHLTTASEAGLVRIWDVASGTELTRIRHPLSVRRISYSQDGQYLASISGKMMFLWDMSALPLFDESSLVTAACARLVRNLTPQEWKNLGLLDEYHPICPNFP